LNCMIVYAFANASFVEYSTIDAFDSGMSWVGCTPALYSFILRVVFIAWHVHRLIHLDLIFLCLTHLKLDSLVLESVLVIVVLALE